MVSPVSGGAAVSEVSAPAQPVSPAAVQPATLKPDTVSISHQGHSLAAGDVDHDGDNA
ncbi:MAG TPA: hypothetical protein VK670_06110 [Silvibacterium sp.]|nr:hypothetical protein [Silvibacterium sp.]